MATIPAVSVRNYVLSLRREIPDLPEPEQLPLYWIANRGGIDLAALRREKAEIRALRRLSPATLRSYQSAFRAFCAWCTAADRSPLPTTEDTISLYVTWMVTADKYRTTSAAVHINAILDAHRRAGVMCPPSKDAFEILSAIRRQRKEHALGKQALSVKHLVRICKAMARATDTNRNRRDLAILVLGFATSLRRSEIAALDLSDIAFKPKGIAVTSRFAKNDQDGKGRVIGVWAGERAATDPVRLLKNWLEVRPAGEGPLFMQIDIRDRVVPLKMHPDSLGDVVKHAVARVGLNPTGFGGHSLRSGAVTAAADRGRSDRELMKLSGHRDPDSIRPYIRESEAFAGRNPLPGVF